LIQKSTDSYIHGSLAEKPIYDAYEKNTVLKEKRNAKKYGKSKRKVIFTILVLFIFCMTLMYRYAVLLNANYTANKLERQYEQIKNENSALKVELEENTDITYIKNEAEQRLGMNKPDRVQIVYVNVEKNDITVVHNEVQKANILSDNVFAAIIDKVGKFIHLFY
jgi:cell division protein FtsL